MMANDSVVNEKWMPLWSRWASLSIFQRTDQQSILFSASKGLSAQPRCPLSQLLSKGNAAFDLFEQRNCFKANVSFVRRTALHEACSYGALEEAKLLIGFGCDPEMPSKDDLYTPMHCACQRNRLQVGEKRK